MAAPGAKWVDRKLQRYLLMLSSVMKDVRILVVLLLDSVVDVVVSFLAVVVVLSLTCLRP